MNRRQTLVAMRMLCDPRIPLEHSAIFPDDMLQRGSHAVLEISEERLGMLYQYVPDLVCEYRDAGIKKAASTACENP
jgi:hypothetical protein